VLHRQSPNDKDVAIKFANALAEIGQTQRAEQILANLYSSMPSDNDGAQALKDLSARKTLKEGGYEALSAGTGSYRDILKDKEEATLLEQENRQVRTEDTTERLIREYESRLQNEPRNAKLMRDLAELYSQKKDFDRALAYYQQLKSSDVGADAAIDRAITDTTVRKYDYQLSSLSPDSQDYEEAAARLKTEKDAFKLAEAQKRVDRFPTDLQLRFELGQLLFDLGKTSEAIQEFQRAQNNPHRKIQAMSYLAQCFSRRNMHDLAARTLQNALREKPGFDDEKKDLVYLLGCTLEKLGKREEAVEQFKQIYEVDIGYKDVAAKVDAYYASPPTGQE
jgi:tetratricopeptide (TPR) repeat protein